MSPLTPPIVLSGAASLVYQVAWSKALGLVFGCSAHAVATCLAVFLGGLALGSAWFGAPRRSERATLQSYAALELGVAAAGALSLLGLRALHALVPSAALSSTPRGMLERVAGSALVLLPATFLMGGTLPILVRATKPTGRELEARLGSLYARNTLGAAAGAFVAGFFLLARLGLRGTIATAVATNVVAGLWAWRVARALPKTRSEPVDTLLGENGAYGRSSPLLVVFAITGATALAYEVAWTRLLSTILGSSLHALTLMLAILLAGMALGSAVFERMAQAKARRGESLSLRDVSLTQAGIALAAGSVFLVLRVLVPSAATLVSGAHGDPLRATLAEAVVAAAAVLPVATLLGFHFPLLSALIDRGRPGVPATSAAGATVGRAYAWNTAGAIAGALLTGFVLLPALGACRVLAACAAVNALLALGTGLAARPRVLGIVRDAALAAGLAWVASCPQLVSPSLTTFGAALYGSVAGSRLTFQEIVDTEDIVFAEDGLTATVAVVRSDDYVALKINGKVDASSADRSTQLLLGDLGAVLHPAPRRVLVIGLGGGMTLSALARFPDVERIDCVEIEPALVRAASALGRLHRGVLSDPRVHLMFDDARSVIQGAGAPYDLIVSEPSNPWVAGVAALFTDEFYSAVRRRLAPGGMLVQWVQAYGLEPDDVRGLVATLAPHFDDLTLWHSGQRDFLVVARTQKGPLDLSRARRTWGEPSLQEDLRALGITTPEAWLGYFRLGDEELRGLAAGARTNTDDRSALEYKDPFSMMDPTLIEELESFIQAHAQTALGGELAPADVRSALLASATAQLDANSPWAARTLASLADEPPSGELELLRGRLDLTAHRPAPALAHFATAERLGGDRVDVETFSALAERAEGRLDRAAVRLDDALARRPTGVGPLRARIEVARAQRDWARAAEAQKTLLGVPFTRSATEVCALGDLQLRAGARIDAEASLREGLALDPYAFLCRRELGELERVTGRTREAREDLEFVARHFPLGDPKTFLSLALLNCAEGKLEQAEEMLAKGRRLFPDAATLRSPPD